MNGRWRALALVALLGASVASCSDDGPGEGEAQLEVDGTATVERADGDRETIDDSTDLGSGDRVSVRHGMTRTPNPTGSESDNRPARAESLAWTKDRDDE